MSLELEISFFPAANEFWKPVNIGQCYCRKQNVTFVWNDIITSTLCAKYIRPIYIQFKAKSRGIRRRPMAGFLPICLKLNRWLVSSKCDDMFIHLIQFTCVTYRRAAVNRDRAITDSEVIIVSKVSNCYCYCLIARTLLVPPVRRSTLCHPSFPVAAPRAWNSLLSAVRTAPSLITFRRELKTFLYHSNFVDC